MLESRSPLTRVLHEGGGRVCVLSEITGWSLVQAAGFAATKAAFEKSIASVIGKKPPSAVGKAATVGDRLLLRTGPEQLWILAASGSDVASRLSEAIPPDVGAVTDLSHSRARLSIEGDSARDILNKGIPLDLDPKLFRVSDFAQTGLHHTPILLYRPAADRYEIWPMRTFALSIWHWLVDATPPLRQVQTRAM